MDITKKKEKRKKKKRKKEKKVLGFRVEVTQILSHLEE
jgi:hypothetical protein